MSSSNSPCAACKFLRRKCTQECVFAPYFPPDNPHRFACVHRVFGASNVGKILNELSVSQRDDAVKSLAYEAEARLRDPVYGCVGFISILQQRLRQIHTDLHNAKKELSTYISPQAIQNLINPTATAGLPGNPYASAMMYPYGGGGHGGGLVIRDPQQQQQQEFLEAQQLAAVAAAAREQQFLLRSYEQQQEFMRLSGFEPAGSVSVAVGDGGGGDTGAGDGSSGFGHQVGSGSGCGQGEMPPPLALGTIEAQLLLSPQQQGQHSQQQQPQQQSESEEALLQWLRDKDRYGSA